VAPLRVAFLGDIFGAPGRMVVQQQLPRLREDHRPDLVIANAENARSGSGLTPELFEKLRGYGIDGITLGDHAYRDAKILKVLETPGMPILRPANLSGRAAGRPVMRLTARGERERTVYIITVLGRVFFPLPADDPFATVDRILESLPGPRPIVMVEAHMEATSEKAALAHHLDGRVAAVIGTHTHVPTADARILRGGTAFITDVGMCGPYDSVIGRSAETVLRYMTTGMHTSFEVGRGGEAMCGVIVDLEDATGRAASIVRVEYLADQALAPFV
jgi:hypothetical protein